MLTAITEPEAFEREGKQYTRQKLMSGTTTINLIRPVLTPEEYESRRKEIEKAAIELVKSTIKAEDPPVLAAGPRKSKNEMIEV